MRQPPLREFLQGNLPFLIPSSLFFASLEYTMATPATTIWNTTEKPTITVLNPAVPVETTVARVITVDGNVLTMCEKWKAEVKTEVKTEVQTVEGAGPQTNAVTVTVTNHDPIGTPKECQVFTTQTTESSSISTSPKPTETDPTKAGGAGQTPSENPGSKSGVSGGAVAGAAIGCLIAGALIGALICFLLYRRRLRKQAPISYESHLPYNGEHKSGATAVATSVPAAAGSNIDALLPQPVDDDTMTKELSKIRDNIKNHVQSYYHFQPVNAPIDTSMLAGLATATNISAAALAGLIANPATRSDALRLYVAWAVLSKFEGGGQPSLLPAGIPALLDNMSGKASDPSEYTTQLRNIDFSDREPAKSSLFSKWKVLTGTLLGANANAHPQSRSQIIDSMDAVLGPFLQPGFDLGRRRDNLEMVLSRAAKLALLLFSQPGSFRMDFVGGRPDVFVVFPGLVQVVGDQGQALSRPRVLSEKEFATSAR